MEEFSPFIFNASDDDEEIDRFNRPIEPFNFKPTEKLWFVHGDSDSLPKHKYYADYLYGQKKYQEALEQVRLATPRLSREVIELELLCLYHLNKTDEIQVLVEELVKLNVRDPSVLGLIARMYAKYSLVYFTAYLDERHSDYQVWMKIGDLLCTEFPLLSHECFRQAYAILEPAMSKSLISLRMKNDLDRIISKESFLQGDWRTELDRIELVNLREWFLFHLQRKSSLEMVEENSAASL